MENERDPGCEEMPRRRRHPECRCPSPARGLCGCDDDGDVTHGGCEVEAIDWTDGTFGRQRVTGRR